MKDEVYNTDLEASAPKKPLPTYDRGMMAATILSAMITQGYATDTIYDEAVKYTDRLIDRLNQTL